MTASQHSLLDLPISFFEYDHQRNTFGNVPTHQTTLRRMVRTCYYREVIEAIRQEPDKAKQDELKKHLPAFTPVALLNHRKRDTTFAEKVICQYPLLMGDIDVKDNEGVDMAELKRHLPRLPYIVLCSYSVRGGLWFVVRLPENQTPETLAAHFRYVQKLFREWFEIKLDSTKGGNPCDLRFVSYDSKPYINDNASIMSGSYTPPSPKPNQYNSPRFTTTDKSQLLNRLVKPVILAGDGERHTKLLKAARVAGGHIAAGRLDEETAVCALETIASDWPNFTKSQKTIRDGIRNGRNAPIYEAETVAYPYRQPTSVRQPRQAASKWENLSIEHLSVHVEENLDEYPADWDLKPGQTPGCRLVLSPNRFVYAELTGISPARVFRLERVEE